MATCTLRKTKGTVSSSAQPTLRCACPPFHSPHNTVMALLWHGLGLCVWHAAVASVGSRREQKNAIETRDRHCSTSARPHETSLETSVGIRKLLVLPLLQSRKPGGDGKQCFEKSFFLRMLFIAHSLNTKKERKRCDIYIIMNEPEASSLPYSLQLPCPTPPSSGNALLVSVSQCSSLFSRTQ